MFSSYKGSWTTKSITVAENSIDVKLLENLEQTLEGPEISLGSLYNGLKKLPI